MADFQHKGEQGSSSRFDAGTMNKGIQEGMSGLKDKASDLASAATEKAQSAVGVVSDRARDIASNLGQQAQQAASRVSDTVSESWEGAQHYIQERGLSGMGSDVADLIRRYPLPSLLIGASLGFLIGRSMRD